MRKGIFWLAAIAVLAASVAHADSAVTTCGQELEGDGYLVGDLDCDGFEYGVELKGNGTIDLRGFTISGGEYGIFCQKSCTVFGGGTVRDAEKDGIVAHNRLKIDAITVSDNRFAGVKGATGALVTNAVLTGNARSGAQGLRRLRMIDTVSQANGEGADGSIVRVQGGIISGNEQGGVFATRISARDTTIVDNDVDSGCGATLTCADLEASVDGGKPRVKNVTCGTSYKTGSGVPGESWGVCASD